jgi:hypothetical protein
MTVQLVSRAVVVIALPIAAPENAGIACIMEAAKGLRRLKRNKQRLILRTALLVHEAPRAISANLETVRQAHIGSALECPC